jgi:hypothetical protein
MRTNNTVTCSITVFNNSNTQNETIKVSTVFQPYNFVNPTFDSYCLKVSLLAISFTT